MPGFQHYISVRLFKLDTFRIFRVCSAHRTQTALRNGSADTITEADTDERIRNAGNQALVCRILPVTTRMRNK